MKSIADIPIWVKIATLISVATLPIVVSAIWTGSIPPGSVEEPLATDYEALVRMFLVLPFLLLIDGTFSRRLVSFLTHNESMLREESRPQAAIFCQRIVQLSQSMIPELIIFLSILVYTFGFKKLTVADTDGWYSSKGAAGAYLSFAGYWFVYVVVPLYQYLISRWVWRWMVWVGALVYFNSLKWDLNALHADRMGGLEYLNEIPVLFSFFGLAIGINLAAYMLTAIVSGSQHLLDFRFTIILTCLLVPAFFFTPLIIFFKKLSLSRSKAIDDFGRLIHYHHEHFQAKWYNKKKGEVAEILGSADPSSLADINGGYDALREMKIIPVNYRVFALMVLVQGLPFLPLLGTTYSIKELLNMMIQSVV